MKSFRDYLLSTASPQAMAIDMRRWHPSPRVAIVLAARAAAEQSLVAGKIERDVRQKAGAAATRP